jgi:hypothetical protein
MLCILMFDGSSEVIVTNLNPVAQVYSYFLLINQLSYRFKLIPIVM